jgi:hypothetical protein
MKGGLPAVCRKGSKGEKGMSITIGGGARQVAKKVDVNSYTTIDQVHVWISKVRYRSY